MSRNVRTDIVCGRPYRCRGSQAPTPGAVLALARWRASGGDNSSWGTGGPQYAAELRTLLYFAAELRILLVYLSESLGRLGQNGGHWGATFFIGGRSPLALRRTAPVRLTNSLTSNSHSTKTVLSTDVYLNSDD